MQGSLRVMPVCLAMGEAAGTVAAHAASQHDGDVRPVDVARLRERLLKEGGYPPDWEETARSAAPVSGSVSA